ncbi:hypothetical protein Tco_0553773 [Tanacetum coccineum]
MLKVSPWKGDVRFGKRGKLNPRYVGPFKVIEKVGDVAYKLELPEELSSVPNTFHVSNLKKCYADKPLDVPLDGLRFDDKLQFVEELVEIMDREASMEILMVTHQIIVYLYWNPVKEILLKMNLPDHRKDGDGDTSFQWSQFTTQYSHLIVPSKEIMTAE